MREILFRAKRKLDDKWIYGNIEIEPRRTMMHYYNEEAVWVETGVFLKTVGQYTGLQDKNGKKIFEGDIGKFKRFERTCIGKIVYNQKTAGFEFWWDITVGAYGEKATYTANLSVCDDIELISNVHDNPKLLKGECEE